MGRVAQLYPTRLSITNSSPRLTMAKIIEEKYQEKSKIISEKSKSNLKLKNHAFTLSRSSKRKFFDSLNSMFELSLPRTVARLNGNKIYNFRMGFITLTLPAVQRHSDVVIKNSCLNQFLTELRQKYHVQNYVWKAELQEKGNIHFHICIDRFIDYKIIRAIWNRNLAKLGYISDYQNKFKNLSITEYSAIRKQPIEKIKNAYALGKKYNWTNPNTVDVRVVQSTTDLAVYLSKYLLKGISEKVKSKVSNIEKRKISISLLARESQFGRSWSRSYSLVQLKYENKFDYFDILPILKTFSNKIYQVKHFVDQFFEVYYFKMNLLPKWLQSYFNKVLRKNAVLYNYPFPSLAG